MYENEVDVQSRPRRNVKMRALPTLHVSCSTENDTVGADVIYRG
jgi:hypothetical protein